MEMYCTKYSLLRRWKYQHSKFLDTISYFYVALLYECWEHHSLGVNI